MVSTKKKDLLWKGVKLQFSSFNFLVEKNMSFQAIKFAKLSQSLRLVGQAEIALFSVNHGTHPGKFIRKLISTSLAQVD